MTSATTFSRFPLRLPRNMTPPSSPLLGRTSVTQKVSGPKTLDLMSLMHGRVECGPLCHSAMPQRFRQRLLLLSCFLKARAGGLPSQCHTLRPDSHPHVLAHQPLRPRTDL